MVTIFKHPDLPDYFASVSGLQADTSPSQTPSIAKPYEYGRAILFPRLRFNIDHDFWAALPIEPSGPLSQILACPAEGDPADDPMLDQALARAGPPGGLARRLKREMAEFYRQALPIYDALFAGYRFVRRRIVWRLAVERHQPMHIDVAAPGAQLAQLHVNLDDQPRIWMVSRPLEELYDRFGRSIPRALLASGRPDEIHQALNQAAFADGAGELWDRHPRHVVYMDPGEVWAMDGQQIAHQLFYGRRAVSIAFEAAPESMAKRKRHHESVAQRYRLAALAGD